MTRNLRLELAFNGAGYHGWQRQANADTVQERVEAAVERIFGSHLTVYGCSRTDAGVHARQFFCNFRADTAMEADVVARAVNANLPADIAVKACEDMPDDFHSRYSCVSKQYRYTIWNERWEDPFSLDTSWHHAKPLDAGLMDRAARHFAGTHDFAAFCSAGSEVQSTVRTVYESYVERKGGAVIFTVSANGFLYNMVRIMAGTLVCVSEGKIGEGDIPAVIGSLDRSRAGFTAPAPGLCLERVVYDG